jgi:hypothetical protein
MKSLSLLVVLGVVAVISLSGSQANSVNTSLDGQSKNIFMFEEKTFELFEELKNAGGN